MLFRSSKAGFTAAMPSESKFSEMNHDIHSSSDTMYKSNGEAKLSKDHMLKYAKLAMAFIAELADPIA